MLSAGIALPTETLAMPTTGFDESRLYYGWVRLPCRHTSAFTSSACWKLLRERQGSPKFQCEQFDDLPWPSTPAWCGHTHRYRMPHCWLRGKRSPRPTQEAFSGLHTFTCVTADHLPFLRLSTIRCLLMLEVPFWPGG